jgi:hypothetical protein
MLSKSRQNLSTFLLQQAALYRIQEEQKAAAAAAEEEAEKEPEEEEEGAGTYLFPSETRLLFARSCRVCTIVLRTAFHLRFEPRDAFQSLVS